MIFFWGFFVIFFLFIFFFVRTTSYISSVKWTLWRCKAVTFWVSGKSARKWTNFVPGEGRRERARPFGVSSRITAGGCILLPTQNVLSAWSSWGISAHFWMRKAKPMRSFARVWLYIGETTVWTVKYFSKIRMKT